MVLFTNIYVLEHAQFEINYIFKHEIEVANILHLR